MESPIIRQPSKRSRLSPRHRKSKTVQVSAPNEAHARSAQRSALTNGRIFSHEVDARSAWCRRVKDLVSQHVADLGGVDNISSAETALVRRAATLIAECERREVLFASSAGVVDDEALAAYGTTVNSLRRLLAQLGLERRAKPVQSLDDYLAQRARDNAEVEAE